MQRLVYGALTVIALWGMAAGYSGWHMAHKNAASYTQEASLLILGGRGSANLGPDRLDMLLAVQDPNFWHHNGVDLTTPGAGMTTLTQSLAKRLAFSSYTPGPFNKLRQTSFALALDERVPKHAQIALFLDTVEMGRGPDGTWITGFFDASQVVFARPPSDLTQEEFLTLVSVMIAPGELEMAAPNPPLRTRVARIMAYVEGHCGPHGVNDVWLDGCA